VNRVQAIWQIGNGKNKADVCWVFVLLNSTNQTNQENRTKIIGALDGKCSRTKRFRQPVWSDIDEALLK